MPNTNAYTRTTTISLTEGERAELASMARSRSLPAARFTSDASGRVAAQT